MKLHGTRANKLRNSEKSVYQFHGIKEVRIKVQIFRGMVWGEGSVNTLGYLYSVYWIK